MAGGKRKVNKQTTRGRRNARIHNKALFVVGGELAEWPNPRSTSGKKRIKKKDIFKTKRADASDKRRSRLQRKSKKELGYIFSDSHAINMSQGSVSLDLREGDGYDKHSPVSLVDFGETRTVTFIDEAQSEGTFEPKYTYTYGPEFVLDEECAGGLSGTEQPVASFGCMSHIGAGDESTLFGSPSAKIMQGVSTMVTECLSTEMSYQAENSGYLSIGGRKVYAQDISDQEDDYEYQYLSDGGETNYTESLSGSDGSFNEGSEIEFGIDSDLDEDIAEDYLEGIGGLVEFEDVNKLFVNDYSDDSYDCRSYSQTVRDRRGNSLRKKTSASVLRDSRFHISRSKLMKRVGKQVIRRPSRVGKLQKELAQGPDYPRTKSSKETNRSKNTKSDAISMRQPVPFVSIGILGTETTEVKGTTTHQASVVNGEAFSTSYGAFEEHTTGFGSRMMAKMGFSGGGLGKEGQGMAEPIEVRKRPKSLGLGVQFSDADLCKNKISKNEQYPDAGMPFQRSKQPHKDKGSSSKSVIRHKANGSSSKSRVHRLKTKGLSSKSSASNKSKTFSNAVIGECQAAERGEFEKHTRGFGSKIMAKMGFVDGVGLGRNSQGIVNPLSAVRRPKWRGLGAEN